MFLVHIYYEYLEIDQLNSDNALGWTVVHILFTKEYNPKLR